MVFIYLTSLILFVVVVVVVDDANHLRGQKQDIVNAKPLILTTKRLRRKQHKLLMEYDRIKTE